MVSSNRHSRVLGMFRNTIELKNTNLNLKNLNNSNDINDTIDITSNNTLL